MHRHGRRPPRHVQLSGFAKSAAEKAPAEDLARRAKGVKQVRNSIIVRS